MEKSKYKYINESHLSKFRITLKERLSKPSIGFSEEQIDSIIDTLLKKCPAECFADKYDNDYMAYRIIVDYGKKSLSFYPHLVNEAELDYVIGKRIISILKRRRFSRDVVCKLCEFLSVSLLLSCDKAKEMAQRISVHKNVIEIRQGWIKPEYGESYNYNKRTDHIDWFPFVGIDEWTIFCTTALKF